MQTTAIRHLWGYPTAGTEALPSIKEAGYDGVEAGKFFIDDPGAFGEKAAELGLSVIAQVYSGGFTKGQTVRDHLESLEEAIEWIRPTGATLFNAHSGEDTWTRDQMDEYFVGALEIEKRLGVPIAHELHRGRCLFHAAIATDLLRAHEEIKVVADLSHWVCVSERLMTDQTEALELVADRAVYVHCRVGHENGPQVNDPRAPEWQRHQDTFLRWWVQIAQGMKRRGIERFSFCPEFGPPTYQPTMPNTQEPLADLVEICDWQAERVREAIAEV